MNREILRIALPAIVTNITVPLLGLVDTAIVGHMGAASYMGAIAVGSMMFNLIYWVFGFLRMGTSGLTAQAYGRGDRREIQALLRQSLLTALGIAGGLVILQWPLRELMLWFIGPTPDVLPLAVTYFNIVIWGAPAMLALYAMSGWFIGMQDTRTPMVISILQNIINILASLILVYGFDMKIEGVAWGTVIAQYAGAALALWKVEGGRWKVEASTKNALPPSTIKTYRNIFLRTLCLVAVNLYFTSVGARQGATILAVNTLLMQLYLLFSYIMDGFAYAGEALGGKYWGKEEAPSTLPPLGEAFCASGHPSNGGDERGDLSRLVRQLFLWGLLMTVLFTAVYVIGGMPFLHLLTDEPTVVDASRDYVWWAWLIPTAGVAAFIWDGLFIGTTRTGGMLLSAAVSSGVFFTLTLLLTPTMGNHGLWIAMIAFLAMRGIMQTILWKVEGLSGGGRRVKG